jgi:tetratricopeptide (TPR) repeat protein
MRRRILTVAIVGLTLLSGALSYAQPPDLRERFSQANDRYEQGDYAGAIELYEGLEADGVENADLYYNLGNSYYKTANLGKAVLYYQRALRVSPRNSDARDNLALVRMQLKDKQFVTSQNRLLRLLIWFHNNLSAKEMVIFTSLSWVAFCLIILLAIYRETSTVRTFYRWVSVISPGRLLGLRMAQDFAVAAVIAALLLVTSGYSGFEKLQRERKEIGAVVLLEEIPVYSSPTEDATLQFKIHSGTMVDIVERRPKWVRIRLPGRLSGWVESKAVESV